MFHHCSPLYLISPLFLRCSSNLARLQGAETPPPEAGAVQQPQKGKPVFFSQGLKFGGAGFSILVPLTLCSFTFKLQQVTFGPRTIEGGLYSDQPEGQNWSVPSPNPWSNGPHGPEAAASWLTTCMRGTTCWTATDGSCWGW